MAERRWFKGRAALAVDQWYSSGPGVQQQLERARELLQKPNQSLTALVGDLNTSGHGHTEFRYPLGGALKGDEFERVIRQGYLEAIGLALAHTPPVPIRTFWMTGAGNPRFEMHISDEHRHVSVTLFVPEVEGGADYEGSPEAWVVSVGSDGQVETKQTSGPARQTSPSTRATSDSSCEQLLRLLTQAPHPKFPRVLHDSAEDRSSGAVIAGAGTGAQELRLPVPGSGYESTAPDPMFQVQRPLEVDLGVVPSFECRAQHALVAVGRSETRQPDDRCEEPAREWGEEIVEQHRM